MPCTICCGVCTDCADAGAANPTTNATIAANAKGMMRVMRGLRECSGVQPPEAADCGLDCGLDSGFASVFGGGCVESLLPLFGPPLTRNLPIRSSSCIADWVSTSSSPFFSESGEPPGCRPTYWSPNKPLVNIAAAVSSGISLYLSLI